MDCPVRVGLIEMIDRRELRLSLPPDPRAVAEARDIVTGALARARDELTDEVRLLVSELVTNSLRHGGLGPGDEVSVHLSATPFAVRVEVRDRGRGFELGDLSGPYGTGGYGLQLVARLATRWGVDRTDATTVWFEFDRPFARESSASAA
jgi:anti-sigma regulatory factor (Ser/Thr protein kinase)